MNMADSVNIDRRRATGKDAMLAKAKEMGLDFGDGAKCRISAFQLRRLMPHLFRSDLYGLQQDAMAAARKMIAEQDKMLRKLLVEWRAWRKAQMVARLRGTRDDALVEDKALTQLIGTMTGLQVKYYKDIR